MKRSLFFTIIIMFTLVSACKTRKAQAEANTKSLITETNKVVHEFSVVNAPNTDIALLMYKLVSLELSNNHLVANVQYGGGCVKPHEFELVTNGVVDKEGVMDFYLLHKTTTDKCKALIMEDLHYDLAKLYNLKSTVLKKIRLNGTELIEL